MMSNQEAIDLFREELNDVSIHLLASKIALKDQVSRNEINEERARIMLQQTLSNAKMTMGIALEALRVSYVDSQIRLRTMQAQYDGVNMTMLADIKEETSWVDTYQGIFDSYKGTLL